MSSLLVPIDGFLALLVVALIFFLYGMLLSDRLAPLLVGDVANACGVLMLYFAAVNAIKDDVHRDQLIDGFTKLLLIVVMVAAVLGAMKFLLQLKGQRLGFVASASPGRYPWGTSLVRDYNMYALTLLCGAVIALMKVVHARAIRSRFCAGVAFVVLFTVGLLAGSRRFWVVAPFVVVAMLLIVAYRNGFRRSVNGLLTISVVVGIALLFMSNHAAINLAELYDATDSLRSRLLTLLAGERTEAFGSRLERWEFAFSLAQGASIWIGQGFDYLYIFGCRFGDCTAVDYPHNPLLSALLYSGVVGAMLVGLFFAYVTYFACRLISASPVAMTCAIMLFCHLPFVLVSGNSMFSVTTLSLCAMLCKLLYASREGRAEYVVRS